MSTDPKDNNFFLHIIVPAYGRSPYLSETLMSLKGMANHDQILVTIVDDDPQNNYVSNIFRNFENYQFEYVRNESNLGLASNFKKCMSLSRGKYTLILGSDDRVLPNLIQDLKIEDSLNANLDCLQLRTQIIDKDGKKYFPLVDKIKKLFTPFFVYKKPIKGYAFLASLLFGNWTYFPAIAWKTSMRESLNWNTNLRHAVDLNLLMNLALNGGNIKVSKYPAVEYRRHEESESSRLAATTTRVTEELFIHKSITEKLSGFSSYFLKLIANVAFSIRVHALISALTNFKSDPQGSRKILKIAISSIRKVNLTNQNA